MDSKLNFFVSDIKRAFKDAKILLFGSRATGNARVDSDYDLIIISNAFKNTPRPNRAYLVWSKTNSLIIADLLCYTAKEFKPSSQNSVILQDALKHAIQV